MRAKASHGIQEEITMKKFAYTLLAGAGALALAACGGADDASIEAEADTVEMPADAALEDVTDEAVADTEAVIVETDNEVAEGLILTCQAHPTSATIVVDYDDV